MELSARQKSLKSLDRFWRRLDQQEDLLRRLPEMCQISDCKCRDELYDVAAALSDQLDLVVLVERQKTQFQDIWRLANDAESLVCRYHQNFDGCNR